MEAFRPVRQWKLINVYDAEQHKNPKCAAIQSQWKMQCNRMHVDLEKQAECNQLFQNYNTCFIESELEDGVVRLPKSD